MKIVIVDDEPLARQRLESILADSGGHTVVASAENGKEAIRLCAQYAPDVILLDIRMPEMDGLEVALHLARLEHPPAVVFTTAHDEYALAAFEAQAAAYLLKPVKQAQLEQALARAQTLNRGQLQTLLEAAPQHRRSHISATKAGQIRLIALDDILYFQADQKYVTVRHIDGSVLIEESLRTLESEFGDDLIRIHRNALVAFKHIKGMQRGADGQHYLSLKHCDELLPISRRHLATVRKMLKSPTA